MNSHTPIDPKIVIAEMQARDLAEKALAQKSAAIEEASQFSQLSNARGRRVSVLTTDGRVLTGTVRLATSLLAVLEDVRERLSPAEAVQGSPGTARLRRDCVTSVEILE